MEEEEERIVLMVLQGQSVEGNFSIFWTCVFFTRKSGRLTFRPFVLLLALLLWTSSTNFLELLFFAKGKKFGEKAWRKSRGKKGLRVRMGDLFDVLVFFTCYKVFYFAYDDRNFLRARIEIG